MNTTGTFPRSSISLAILIALSMLLAACSGSGNNPVGQPQEELQQDLEQQLLSELERLGKHPDRIPAVAPQGANNAVFNLQATVIDPDGAGGNPPEGVELSWTARVIGDYDQNGQVGIADITPLGQFFKQTVSYDAAELHDGDGFWPEGDPLGSGAANWRRAAIDGDGNGELNSADITPVAIHFGERMDGFNVYVRQTGESDYSILPNLLDPFRPVSVSLQPAGGGPANYTATIPWPASGMADIAVAGFDSTSGGSAPLSNIVAVSGDPGSPPGGCVAELTADLSSGQAPLMLQFGIGASSTGAVGDYRYVLQTGENAVTVTTEDSADFPLNYSYLNAGNFTARLAVVCIADGSVAFSDSIAITVTDSSTPGLTVSGRVFQFEENPELGNPDAPDKFPLEDIEVQVFLLGETTPLASTTTDANGSYAFPNLQLAESVQFIQVRISDAQKAELLPLTWLPGEQTIFLDEVSEKVSVLDLNLLATPV